MNLNEVIGQEIMEELKGKGYGDGTECYMNRANVVTISKLLYNIMYDAKCLIGVDTNVAVAQQNATNVITLERRKPSPLKGKRFGPLPKPERELKKEIFEGIYSLFGSSLDGIKNAKISNAVVGFQNAFYQRKLWTSRESFESDYRAYVNREIYGNKYV